MICLKRHHSIVAAVGAHPSMHKQSLDLMPTSSSDPDTGTLPALTRRQEEILSCIIRAYTDQPEPVSSKHLVETFNLTFSSATIRSEMAALEELGYIAAPHTSAGRIPTEDGYRYFVKRLIPGGDLAAHEQARIQRKLTSTPLASDQWMGVVANVLSRAASAAALVTPPVASTNRLKHLELIAVQGRLVLLILVFDGGGVHQQMLTLADSLPQALLSETADRLNSACAHLTAGEIRVRAASAPPLEHEVLALIAEQLERADGDRVRLVYRNGLTDLISAFPNNEGAQQAVRVLEEHAYLNLILDDMLTPILNHVQVVIAGDGRWDDLRHLTIVLSRYGIPGKLSGAVGVLGPTHLNYGRAIQAVSYVSSLMTTLLSEGYDDESDKPGDDSTANVGLLT